MKRLNRSALFSFLAIPATLLVAAVAIGETTEAEKKKEHPLDPAIRWAEGGLEDLSKIKGYSATLVKRERVDGELLPKEYIYLKVRHEPFSVYMYFVGPAKMKGRECIYVEGQNDGKMVAHEGGSLGGLIPTVRLDPSGMLAMRGQRYPITEIGILNLTKELIRRAEQDKAISSPVEVKFFKNDKLKINGRSVTCIQVVHPEQHEDHLFYKARIFVDNELNLPVRYESYDFPKTEGGATSLLEEYTYLELDTTKEFTDKDFDPENPNYNF